MKPSFESVHASRNTSFLVRRFREKKFSAPYHFHPEYELTFITQGSGKRYAGTDMNDFFPGDLVLLGSNLPHCWKTAGNGTALYSGSVVIQFQKDFLGVDFFLKPEMKRILQLLQRSSHGIQFTGNTTALQEQMMHVLHEKDKFKRIIIFLELLSELASAKNFLLLNKQNVFAELSMGEQKRINAVMAYIVDNFQDSLSLDAAAAITNMTTPAFCKYFKKMTRKTFMEAVNDYRIDFALQQLINTEKTVAQIGFDSGFNDISNFHKTFRRRTNLSPLGYRKRLL